MSLWKEAFGVHVTRRSGPAISRDFCTCDVVDVDWQKQRAPCLLFKEKSERWHGRCAELESPSLWPCAYCKNCVAIMA